MDYIIKNHKNVYIRINSNGKPVTCSDREKTLFEYSKARNILDNLPKTLKRLNFKTEAVPDISRKNMPENTGMEKVIQKENYVIADNIVEWVEKFGICDDILKEAEKRKEELCRALSDVDRQFSNLIHEIELEGKVDLYGGWIERNKVKENREKRRNIKDELMIISNVLRMDFRNLDRDVIHKAVMGLADRKFTYRIVEEEETDAV